DFLRCPIPAIVRYLRHRVGLQLAVPHPCANRRPAARAVQSVCFGASHHFRRKVRSIAIRTETWQISNVAFRTFHATANTLRHEIAPQDNFTPATALDVSGPVSLLRTRPPSNVSIKRGQAGSPALVCAVLCYVQFSTTDQVAF